MDDSLLPVLRVAAGLLVLGGTLAGIGAFWPPYRQWIAPLEEGLRVIAANPRGWRMIHAGFISGTWISVIALGLLAYALRSRPGGAIAFAVALSFLLAAVFWTVNIAYRLGVTAWAAEQFVRTGAIPQQYAAWRAFARHLFVAFSALGYASVAGLGWMVLASGLAPRGLGWTLVAWGLSFGFVVGANVPVVMYVPFVVLGGFLLRG